ncbi:hypothetical protein EGW08_003879 [Elysia chlorotica]|uniref:Uncharacterized protein n=1 Tax=Elysia chlorotica TaxID=188477 RepID=A0A3S1BTK5_ELYCH|nr:hypothetical protein EGW08_003879 [Elysia chlorotica]
MQYFLSIIYSTLGLKVLNGIASAVIVHKDGIGNTVLTIKTRHVSPRRYRLKISAPLSVEYIMAVFDDVVSLGLQMAACDQALSSRAYCCRFELRVMTMSS